MKCEIDDENAMELEGDPGSNSSEHATGEEVTADVNSTTIADEGKLNQTGSLQFDIVGHGSTSMKLKQNKRIGTGNVRSLHALKES